MNPLPLLALRLRFLAPIVLMVFAVARGGIAQDFSPDLSQTEEWIAGGEAATIEPPADAPERLRYPMPGQEILELQSELAGRPFRVVDPLPRSRAWWKYPYYTIFGMPRDLVDGFFGLVSYVPLVNLPLVAVAYELVPTQVFFRDPRDWHRWPGTTNRRGHGFLPAKRRVRDARTIAEGTEGPGRSEEAWLENETWGFFPTANSMDFTYASSSKFRLYTQENLRLRFELQRLNQEIEAGNRVIDERQRAARAATVRAIDAGDGTEALSHILPYHLAYPGDETANALLLNSLALYGEAGPRWVRSYLWRKISEAPTRVLRQGYTLIRQTDRARPGTLTLSEAIVLIQIRLQEPEQALASAEAAFRESEGEPRRARLYFEVALANRDEEKAAEALRALEALPDAEGDLGLARLRLNLLSGRAAEARGRLTQLVAGAPANPYYHYYLGCAELTLLEETDEPERSIELAFDELELASLTATAPELRRRVGMALNYARGLAADEGPRERRSARRGLIDLQLPQ